MHQAKGVRYNGDIESWAYLCPCPIDLGKLEQGKSVSELAEPRRRSRSRKGDIRRNVPQGVADPPSLPPLILRAVSLPLGCS